MDWPLDFKKPANWQFLYLTVIASWVFAVSQIAASLAESSGGTARIESISIARSIMMADARTPLLPVVEPKSGRLTEIVTRRDVLNAYRSAANAPVMAV